MRRTKRKLPRLPEAMLELREVLSYALGEQVPEGFARHLLRHRDHWDEVFEKRLESYAYEFRPDLAVWEIQADENGHFHERRLPLLV